MGCWLWLAISVTQICGGEVQMDILELARKSGMTIVLDAKIGRQEYRTVHSSVDALERFAKLVAASVECEALEHH
jgi:hypothetical protein